MARPPQGSTVDAFTAKILASPKYRGLDEDLVRRVATEASERVRDKAQALKYARRKLHQAYGAFLQGSPVQAVDGVVAGALADPEQLRPLCLSAMRTHVSSAERIDWLEPFYDQVRQWCGTPASMIDLACGLNSLSIPWMHLAPGASYWACELDAQLVAALQRLHEVLPVEMDVSTCDLVTSPPDREADVALLLKTVTTIEQQAPSATHHVLLALRSRHVVVTFPRHSISGRRGYSDESARVIQAAVRGTSYRITGDAELGSETLYHLEASELSAAPG